MHVLTLRWVLNIENKWTQGEEHHTLGAVGGWGGQGRDSMGWGGWGGITWGEMLDIDERGIEAAKHLVVYAPMQQPCMTCTCTPEPKVQ